MDNPINKRISKVFVNFPAPVFFFPVLLYFILGSRTCRKSIIFLEVLILLQLKLISEMGKV